MKKIRTILKIIGYILIVIWVLSLAYDYSSTWRLGPLGFFLALPFCVPLTLYSLFILLITKAFGELAVSIIYLLFAFFLIAQADNN